MPTLARRTRVVLGLAALVAALAAWQGTASAALNITSATLDGVTSTSSPPGGVLKAGVKVKATGGDAWRSTRYVMDGQTQCASGDSKGGFNVTAPGTPGSYDAVFTAFAGNNCTGTASGQKVLSQALRVTPPAPNPDLPPRCGIDVMLVLDESGSINTSGATEQVRDAARAFLDALSGTGASVAITDFSTSAGRPVGYTTVTPASIATVFEPYLVNGYKPSGLTNWEDALLEVKEANEEGPVADLVVFITDGDPTTYNGAGGKNVGEGAVTALRPAAFEADLVKGQGSHVFALGVGAAVTKPTSARRLTAISGFDQYPATEFAEADYTLVQDFDDLAQALRDIAIELCQASVTVTKLVDEGDGVYRPDPGWRFTASLSVPGGYAWVQPPPATPPGPRSQTTDKDGVATFQWKPTNPDAISTISMTEALKPGYEFVDYACSTNAPGRTRKKLRRGLTSDGMATGTIRPNEYAKCTVRNRIIPGTIEIEKDANPEGKKAFPFVGSLGPFALVDDGSDTSSRTFTGLTPGTYTVRELVPDDWELTGVTCTPAAAAAIAGPEVTITLAPGGAVVCTYRDTRTDPPVPPGPPAPPTPPGPPGPPTPPPPPPVNPFGVAQLTVVKTAPRVARVGQTIQFELTVRNVGADPARDVIMADVPPAALTLSGLRADRRARLVRGNALWRLGTLAPGASRTVRGSVRIDAGTPGLKRNHVLAGAVNARLVQNEADTRVLQQRPVTPPVTG